MHNIDSIISELYGSFNQGNVILFAGSDAIKNGELTDIIVNLPWSCVITTIKKDDFAVQFANGRSPHKYVSVDELPINIFSRDNLPIIQMLGSDTELPKGSEDIDEFIRNQYVKKHAEKILNRIMSRMDIRSRMIVLGYNPDSEYDISLESFIFGCKEIKGGTVSFFNSQENKQEVLFKFAEKNNYVWFDGKLSEELEDSYYKYEIKETTFSDGENLFYKGNQSVFINRNLLSRSRNIAQLITEEKIKEIRPLGRAQKSRWFYNFLNNSSDTPQWYGFLPQSLYYLKRNYEDALLTLVSILLNGKEIRKSEWNTPVILEGDPGSSKSIELAAVAYKVFEERVNPVIYINGDNLYFTSQSNELQVLDELMQEVERVGEKDTRFLIVWDSSAYKNIDMEAKALAHELENRGRRFVLLCSAYSNTPTDKDRKGRTYFKYRNDVGFEKTDEVTDVYYINNCYYVTATRSIDDNEKHVLQEKAKLYAFVDKKQIDKIWSELESSGEKDIFNYFYRLITLIRPKLEAGLSREQRLVNRYVRKQLSLFENRREEEFNPILEALRNAGIELDEESMNAISDEENDEVYDIDKFNICIAMFSRFKLDTPYSLALMMLCKNKEDYFGNNSYYNNYELFKLITSQINYIHYVEKGDGKYVFRFRNVLEAELFLKNNQISEDRQLEIILDIIDHYIEDYRRNNEVDDEVKESIQAILKMYGPNTDYKEFWENHTKFSQHQIILRKLEPLAEKIHRLRTHYHIPDDDGGMALIEISFYRELFGSMWDRLHNYSKAQYSNASPWEIYPETYTEESYQNRLRKLYEVSNLALGCLEQLGVRLYEVNEYTIQRRIQASINSLTVELAVANSEMERIKEEYEIFLNGQSCNVNVKPLSYATLLPFLLKAISASPLNGYLYNALFRLFEKEYNRSEDERKLQLLSEVGMIADDANTLEIVNRGANDKDELSGHLSRIAQYSCSYEVKINDIINKTAPKTFSDLFYSMIERNNAAGICFVCQQELNSVGLSGNEISSMEKSSGQEFVLNNQQLEVCKSIVNFINNPEYSNCVDRSIQALYLLLRVEWMLYNGRPLSIGREWQRTYLTQDDWLKVYSTCERYESISGSSVRPVVTLIYAMAKIHINGDYLGAIKAMHRVSDMPNQRMRVPYLICFEPGVPKKFSGTVMSTHNYAGFIKVDGLPIFYEKNQGVKFFMKNLGLRKMPDKNKVLKDFCLGLSLASQFSACIIEEGE